MWAYADMERSRIGQDALRSYKSTDTLESETSQPPSPDGDGLPVNFHFIGPGLYRSSYPQASHFSILQTYGFKTIITLVPTEVPEDNRRFIVANGITHHQVHVVANKDPEVYATDETMSNILKIMMNPENHPVLIHCNKGKHRTGCVVALFRKCTGWPLDTCLAEYERYASNKARDLDKAFIARFDVSDLKALALEKGFVTGAFSPHYNLADSSNASAYTNNTVASYEGEPIMNPVAEPPYLSLDKRNTDRRI